jgi:hypothetical protein
MSHSVKRALGVAAAALLAAGLTAVTAVAQPPTSAHISGTVGETVDPGASNGGFFLRYVGDPAPPGYSHDYQWAGPFIETRPESGPVTFTGTLDLTDRTSDNSVAMIGLLDKADLEAGNHSFQRGAYIYVNNRPDGTVRIGVTDGNSGGEIVQTFLTIPAATADAGPLDVVFTVDGTADPATCAVPPGSGAAADGCLTLSIDGIGTISDSYGTLVGTAGSAVEFATGAIPGWEAFPSGAGNVGFDMTIEPTATDPQTKEQCKDGGYEAYGFRNQGQCVRFVETGKDSR